MAAKRKDTRPSKDISVITQTALKAHALAIAYEAALKSRLPEDILDGLTADLVALGVQVPGVKLARAKVKAATAGQGEALAHGYALVTAVRMAVSRSDATRDVRKEYGVGVKVSPKVVKDVKAVLMQIIDRANAHPAEAAAAGLVPSDIVDLSKALEAVKDADHGQEKLRAGAPLTTQERNQTARRILSVIDRIATAGVLHFAAKETERARFEALIRRSKPKKKPQAK